MKKLASFLTASVTALSALLTSALFIPVPEVSAADQVNIMPIGDSITYGLGEDGGYRKYLDNALHEKGIAFDMVGPEGRNSATAKNMQYDDNHAGYSGYTIKQQYPVPSWSPDGNGLLEVLQKKDAIKNAQPDIVLLIIGTNDMTANRNLNDCEQDLHSLVDYILENMPQDGVIFMGSIPEFTEYGGNPTRVGNYNSTVQKVAESYGDNVRFADVHGCLNGMNDIGNDNLHPNGGGYEKMGKFWADVIEDYLGNQTPVDPDNPEILHSDFENGISGWKARGNASVDVTSDAAAEGSQSASVTGRKNDWSGIAYTLSSKVCPAGTNIDAQVRVMQKTGSTVHFKLSMQYEQDGQAVYDTFAEGDAESGEWLTITAMNYTVQQGTSPILYIETKTDTCDFYLDEVLVMKSDGSTITPVTPPAGNTKKGDVDGDNMVNKTDAQLLIDYLTGKASSLRVAGGADMDDDTLITVKDLSLLKALLMQPAQQDEPQGTHDTQYMSKIANQLTATVPQSALAKTNNTVEHITYFSKKANRNKGANVWLPPGYDKSKKYPVFYVNHGYGGDEGSMVNGNGILEIATNLINSGDAEPMIIVFTNQYTDPNHEKQTGNGQADVPGYDNFVEDLPDSLMPYIEANYPVKTGRENTAIAGFSMGGRESLYCGMKCCDKIGYIGAAAPAPGIFPTKDQFMDHPGVMSKDDMRIDPPYSPYVLMIAGGTNDGMVNDFPKQYSDLFTQHGTENLFLSVPGGGHDSSTVTPLMYNFIRVIFKA